MATSFNFNGPSLVKDNLSRRERALLKKLCNRKDIRTSKSDKGDTIAAETMERNITDGLKHLSDEIVYKCIEMDISPELHNKIITFDKHSFNRGLISHDAFSFLTQNRNIKTPFINYTRIPSQSDR